MATEKKKGNGSTQKQADSDEEEYQPLLHIFDEDEWHEHTYVLDRAGSFVIKALGWTQVSVYDI